MKRVIIESPFNGDRAKHVRYARRALLDSLQRGEAPLASHLLYPQVLDDSVPAEREQGIAAGLAWLPAAELVAFYADYGFSPGMLAALSEHGKARKPIEVRYLFKRNTADESSQEGNGADRQTTGDYSSRAGHTHDDDEQHAVRPPEGEI